MLQCKRTRAGSAARKAEQKAEGPAHSMTSAPPQAGEEPAPALRGAIEKKEAAVSVDSV